VNERRNPTTRRGQPFLLALVSRFFPEGMTVQRSGSGQIGVESPLHFIDRQAANLSLPQVVARRQNDPERRLRPPRTPLAPHSPHGGRGRSAPTNPPHPP
jgi:hypothetical protein